MMLGCDNVGERPAHEVIDSVAGDVLETGIQIGEPALGVEGKDNFS
jgi:hypothetical protein